MLHDALGGLSIKEHRAADEQIEAYLSHIPPLYPAPPATNASDASSLSNSTADLLLIEEYTKRVRADAKFPLMHKLAQAFGAQR